MEEVIILLAAYKGNKFIREQLDSIINQDCSCWHLIVSDDGTYTSEILQEYADTYPDRITHYKSGLQFGSAKVHFMHLIKMFGDTANYYMFCDQDDVWHRDKIRVTYDKLTEMEAQYGKNVPLLVHTSCRVVDCDLKEVSSRHKLQSPISENLHSLNHLLVFNMVTGCTMMINNSLMSLANFDIPLDSIQMHDWWLALLASAFGKIGFISKPTMDYRQHENNSVGSANQLTLEHFKSDVTFGSQRKYCLQDSKQALALLTYYEDKLNPEQIRMLSAFSRITNYGKFKRIGIYLKYKLLKPGLIRQIEQLVFW